MRVWKHKAERQYTVFFQEAGQSSCFFSVFWILNFLITCETVGGFGLSISGTLWPWKCDNILWHLEWAFSYRKRQEATFTGHLIEKNSVCLRGTYPTLDRRNICKNSLVWHLWGKFGNLPSRYRQLHHLSHWLKTGHLD